MNLSEMKIGSSAKVVAIRGDSKVKKRIMDMGITKGTIVEKIKTAPMGDPIELRIRGYELSIREHDAANIEVE